MKVEIIILIFILISVISNYILLGSLKSYIEGMIFVIYIINYKILPKMNLMNLLYFAIGFFIASLLTQITFFIVFRERLKMCTLYPLKVKIVIKVVWEEIIWRVIVLSCMNKLLNYYIMNNTVSIIISVLFSTILFIFYHVDKDKKNYIEMFLYSLFISISYIIFPGMNYGLHIGRNCYILWLQSLNQNKQIEKVNVIVQ